jgi:hypothetical protein
MLAILVNIALSPRSVSVIVGRQIEACRMKFERTPRDSGSNTRILAQIVDQSTNASIFCLVPTFFHLMSTPPSDCIDTMAHPHRMKVPHTPEPA